MSEDNEKKAPNPDEIEELAANDLEQVVGGAAVDYFIKGGDVKGGG